MIAAFSALTPSEATLVVQGNHDHWMGPENIRAVFNASGVIELANGLYQVGEMLQYTNRGVGTHVFRVRYNCSPEITVITLQRG